MPIPSCCSSFLGRLVYFHYWISSTQQRINQSKPCAHIWCNALSPAFEQQKAADCACSNNLTNRCARTLCDCQWVGQKKSSDHWASLHPPTPARKVLRRIDLAGKECALIICRDGIIMALGIKEYTKAPCEVPRRTNAIARQPQWG